MSSVWGVPEGGFGGLVRGGGGEERVKCVGWPDASFVAPVTPPGVEPLTPPGIEPVTGPGADPTIPPDVDLVKPHGVGPVMPLVLSL